MESIETMKGESEMDPYGAGSLLFSVPQGEGAWCKPS